MKNYYLILLMVLAACTPISTTPQLACEPDDDNLTVPDGFCVIVVADSVGRARHLTVRDNGDVYVALRRSKEDGGIAALRDLDGDGRADSIAYFGNLIGTGIELRDNWLYFGADTIIVRHALVDGALVPDGPAEVIVAGFHDQPSHAAKPFTFDGSGNLYVNIGAPANACQVQRRAPGSEGQDPCPLLDEYAGIWRYSADTMGQDAYASGARYASGIRNAVAITWHPGLDQLFVVQHGRDDLHRLWPDRFTDEQNNQLPAEELFAVDEGDDFGWPYCYYDHFMSQKLLGPEYGGDGSTVGRCGDAKDPAFGFSAHWAPNDILIYTGTQWPERYHGGVFVAFHGSWNRSPVQAGFEVTFLAMDGGTPTGAAESFVGGFVGSEPVSSPGSARARPTGLALGPDGSVYISDSVKGRIWRIVHTGAAP